MYILEMNNKYNRSVRWGIVREKNLSSQLDSATIVLTQVANTNVETYDLIKLVGEANAVEYWLVANVNRQYVTYSSPFLFDYTLDLMSLTKWLETIILPSMAITNIGQNRSIKSYIQRIIEHYVLPQLSNYVDTATYTGLDSRFDEICPEQTFEQTTVREYLDWLAGVFGCCIKLSFVENRTIDVSVLDLNPTGVAVDGSLINDIKDTQSATDYVTELEHNLQEVIGQNTITEYVKFKGDGYIFNTENAVGILSHKAYDITKVVVKSQITINHKFSYTAGSPVAIGEEDIPITNLDITKYVITEDIYSTLELPSDLIDDREVPVPDSESATTSDVGIGTKYKTNCLYWNRGDNHIKNINSVETFKWFFGDNETLTAFASACIEAYLESNWVNPQITYSGILNGGSDYYKLKNYTWDDMILEVTYTPYISPRLKVEQKDSFSHLITMPDSSTNTQTEIGKFLAYSLEKNSKLGNKSKIFTAYSDVINADYTPKLDIGMTWTDENNDKYVISTIEYTSKQSAILYKGTLTKNYINQNIFTSVNREKRYFSLPDASEVVERKEVIKEFYQVKNVSSVTGLTVIPSSSFATKPLFMSLRVTLADETQILPALYADTLYGGNLVAHSASFIDNVSYGSEATEGTNGGVKMVLKKYVDDNGEAVKFDFEFRTRNSNNNAAADADMMEKLAIGETPIVTETTSLDGNYSLSILKDAREKIAITVEKIFYAGATNVTIGNNFAELFNNTSELIWVLFTYTYNGSLTTEETQMSKASFLGGLWRLFLPHYTGTLVVRKNKNNTAITYLTIRNYNYGDYIVILDGTKRG